MTETAQRRYVDTGVTMTTRDGVVLRATVHRQADREAQPVILIRNPYGEPLTRGLPVTAFVAAGFAVVIQDCRGTGDSDGEFITLVNEVSDTEDAIAWCADAPFSNRRVVTYGASYSGMVQLAVVGTVTGAAAEALAAIIPVVAPHDYQTGLNYRGGALQLGQLTGWYMMKTLQELMYRSARGIDIGDLMPRFGQFAADPWRAISAGPIIDAPILSEVIPTWREVVSHPEGRDYWNDFSYRETRLEADVPALHVGGWFDLFLGGTLDNFHTLSTRAPSETARSGQRLIIGPWQHTDQSGTIGDLSFGGGASAAGLGLERIVSQFAAAAVAGETVPGPPVRVYVMNAGRWREAEAWPIPDTRYTSLFLRSGGSLTLEAPADTEPVSSYRHDPSDPVPMRGGQSGIMGGGINGGSEWSAGPRDQRPLDSRTDIVRFVADPLDRDVEITGPVRVRLFAATDAADTDFVARLIDVDPNGRALGVVDGIVRAQYRHGQDRSEPITPGDVVEYDIDLWATSWLFRAGHRIRVDIASSSYPQWDVNLGQVRNNGLVDPGDGVTATQRIVHDADHPSAIILPVVSDARPVPAPHL